MIFVLYRENDFSSTSGVQISAAKSSVLLKQIGCALSTNDCGKTFTAVLKFGNGLSCNIPLAAGSLSASLQGKQAFLDLQLAEVKGKGFIVKVLSVYGPAVDQLLAAGGSILGATSKPVLSASSGVVKMAASGKSPSALVSQSKPKKPTNESTVAAASASDSFIVLKCITALAKQPGLTMPLAGLSAQLSAKIPEQNEKVLICLFLDYSLLFGLMQDSTGTFNVQLKMMDVKAAEQLLRLCSNVSVKKQPKKQPATAGEQQQQDLTALVPTNAVVLDGLKGMYYPGEPDAMVVLDFEESQMAVGVVAGLEMKEQLVCEDKVRVGLTVVAKSRQEIQACPLWLLVGWGGHNPDSKLTTVPGSRFKYDESAGIRISSARTIERPPTQVGDLHSTPSLGSTGKF